MSPDDSAPWQYKPDNGQTPPSPSGGSAETPPKTSPLGEFSWEGPEFVEHHHGGGWYLVLVIATSALAAVVYLVSKDYIATGTIVAVGIIVGVFAVHKPKSVRYEINNSGLNIGDKQYRYSDYKSFAVVREGDRSSLSLFPLKRFVPPLTVYFEPSEEQTIIDALGNYLPYEQRRLDPIDRLSRRLRL